MKSTENRIRISEAIQHARDQGQKIKMKDLAHKESNGYIVGDVFYMNKRGKPHKCHVCGIVEDQIVYKWYKQWWHYQVDHPKHLDIWLKRGK